jgi:Zn-dependent peptidase ImmA (M78 family)
MKPDKAPKELSPSTIEHYAERLRVLLMLGDAPYFNIVNAVENDLPQHLRNFSIEVFSREELGVAAHTEFGPARVLIRQDVYDGAHQDDPKSRFTIAHELGHLCLHWGYPMPRLAPESPQFQRSPVKRRVEAEANLFASAFLMPKAVALKYNNKSRLAKICRVSELAATIRLSHLLLSTDELTTTDVRNLFGVDKA